ncbi:CGNR zinc finger domain-containing protein [Pseudomonas syringae]|uniref:CGNR zinc finger domain-containing protein n=1 Tax=Pseudomonas syringae TaxID=317 RepID=UPI003990932A
MDFLKMEAHGEPTCTQEINGNAKHRLHSAIPDLSKSHPRRGCSMATCGNRMKVAAFRSGKELR